MIRLSLVDLLSFPMLVTVELGYDVMKGDEYFCVVINECRYKRGM